jgi:hypothetical protein
MENGQDQDLIDLSCTYYIISEISMKNWILHYSIKFLLISLILFPITVSAQDYIYKMDKTIQKSVVIEVTLDKIKFKKAEIPKGPTYEILIKDVYKIVYSNGYQDILDSAFNATMPNIKNPPVTFDTTDFALISVLFHSTDDASSSFPLYFNDKYIMTIKNHQRLTYKMYSEGNLTVGRKGGDKDGPSVSINIHQGMKCAIQIVISKPYALDPNKKYQLKAITDTDPYNTFMRKRFYGFKPFPEDDLHMVETKESTIIK